MNKKGQDFLVELFSMLIIFSVIIVIISLNTILDSSPISFTQKRVYDAYTREDVLLLFHETVEIVSISNSLDEIKISSEKLDCNDCNRYYNYLTYLSRRQVEPVSNLKRDEYETIASIRFGLPGKINKEYHLIEFENNFLTDEKVLTGLYFPTERRNFIFGIGGEPDNRINSDLYLLNPKDNYRDFFVFSYDMERVGLNEWRISVKPLEGEIIEESVDDEE